MKPEIYEMFLATMDDLKKSGLSVKAYGKKHNIEVRRLYFMRWQVRKIQGEALGLRKQVQPVDKETEILPRRVGMVVGYRDAARVLGVSASMVKARIRRMRAKGNLRLKIGVSDAGQTGYAWESEAVVKAWWKSISSESKETEAISSVPNNDAMPGTDSLSSIVLPEFYKELLRIQGKFNTPAQKMLRRTRGESEEVTVAEILNLVMGVGLSNWPED